MADVYLVYAREDHGVAKKLFDLLSQRWDVWWDDLIVGDVARAIEREMPKARCALPLWSPISRDKTSTVIGKLRLAERHQVPIIPAMIEACDPPYGYDNLSYSDMRGWDGDVQHPGFLQLQQRIAQAAPPRVPAIQPSAIAGGKVPLPALFLSVSSHETQLLPSAAVEALRVFGTPTVLISAYDVLPERCPPGIIEALAEHRQRGGFVLIDSGNYEAYRRCDKSWNPDELKRSLADTPHDWAFSFDLMDPAQEITRAVDEVVAEVERDQSFTCAPILPIVHACRLPDGSYSNEGVPALIHGVADRLKPPMIAIPERELGSGIFERARTVRRIREALSILPFYQPLHLLGTGHPWTIAILAATGADSFDGLEWCRHIIDHDTGRLHHYQHLDFFAFQGRRGDYPLTAAALDDDKINFAGKAAFHNLAFYADFSGELRRAAKKRRL